MLALLLLLLEEEEELLLFAFEGKVISLLVEGLFKALTTIAGDLRDNREAETKEDFNDDDVVVVVVVAVVVDGVVVDVVVVVVSGHECFN